MGRILKTHWKLKSEHSSGHWETSK